MEWTGKYEVQTRKVKRIREGLAEAQRVANVGT